MYLEYEEVSTDIVNDSEIPEMLHVRIYNINSLAWFCHKNPNTYQHLRRKYVCLQFWGWELGIKRAPNIDSEYSERNNIISASSSFLNILPANIGNHRHLRKSRLSHAYKPFPQWHRRIQEVKQGHARSPSPNGTAASHAILLGLKFVIVPSKRLYFLWAAAMLGHKKHEDYLQSFKHFLLAPQVSSKELRNIDYRTIAIKQVIQAGLQNK